MQIQKLINKVLIKYRNKYELLGEGRNRAVFIKDDKWVIKVPLNEEGIEDQYTENNVYKSHKDENIYAECSLRHDQDIPILLMERVILVENLDNLPAWVDFVDCHQVGYTSDGRLVVFDYGDF